MPIKTSPLICRDLFGVPHLPKDVGESEAKGAADGAAHGVHDDGLSLVALAERCGASLRVLGRCGGDLRGEHVVAERALAERTWMMCGVGEEGGVRRTTVDSELTAITGQRRS